VRLRYMRGDGRAVERTVDPLGLVAKGSLWYLIAAIEGEPRTYRADRVSVVEPTGEAAQRSPDFDLASYWSASQQAFLERIPRFPVRMRVAPAVLQHVEAVGTFATIEEQSAPDGDGWRTLSVAFQSEDMALAFAFRYVNGCEVLEPDVLRRRIRDVAEQAHGKYA